MCMVFSIPAAAGDDPVSSSTDTEAIGEVNPVEKPVGASYVITFSEFPVGTLITTQYQNVGIIFGGDAPKITGDGAFPTTPVLAAPKGGRPYGGDITGTFIDPGTGTPTIVESFTFDAGYFDSIGSTHVEWFDLGGNSLGQILNSKLAIERFTIGGGNIASWEIPA